VLFNLLSDSLLLTSAERYQTLKEHLIGVAFSKLKENLCYCILNDMVVMTLTTYNQSKHRLKTIIWERFTVEKLLTI